MIPAPMSFQGGPLSYDTVLAQSTPFNTTVYVGNLVPFATQTDLIPLFQSIGYVSEIRIQSDRGFAFVKLDTHENAAMAIVQLQGQMVHGRPIKCSWGKDRASEAPAATAVPQQAYGAMPAVYSMPQAAAYPSYGYPGYAGDATGAGVIGQTPAMPTAAATGPVSPGGSAAGWGAATDPTTAAAQQAYYQQYWSYYQGQQGDPTHGS